MPAIRLLDTEHQTELAYLHEQLIEGEPVQDKSWRYAEEYLMQLGIYNVILVEENDVRNYKRFLLEDRDCTIRAANSMTSFLRNKKAYWIEQEYGDLLEEIRQCEGIEMPLTGNIKNFLIREGIHHIREIDYSIREKYEQYLMKEKKPEQVLRYLKTLDRIKQYHIRQEMKQFANIKKFYLKYEQQILFLPYLPDQKLAMEFDKVRDKTELVWDFSVKASEKMKQQIFQLLIHILENVKDPKDRRVLLMPEAVEALKQMILVAWAGGESVMDLRCLLDGRKVPLVKSADKWVVSLSQLPLLLTDGGSVRGNDSGEGVGYSDYIRMFLFLKSVPEITMRTLDCVEEALHSKHILFQADQCVTKLEIQNKITVYKNLNYQYPVYFGYE